jgi:zinc protease
MKFRGIMENLIKVETLENGLKVLLKEIHTAPIISHWVWYRVGSRNEVPGKTGISHWVEHMQFKGTPKFPAGVLDRAISRDGGLWNAFTHLDWTTFFETVPADKFTLPLELESDRMVNSIYDTNEVNSERTVIISEREGNENEPLFRLDEAIQLAAFDSHPYRNEVLGSIKDLKSIQRDDLYHHYQTYYNPANAVLAVAGDFSSPHLLDSIRKSYAAIPAREVSSTKIKIDQKPQNEKRVEVKGPGETTYLQLSWRAPSATDKDFFLLTVLDSLLTGPSSLNMFGGGGISNKTSRLYKALVEKELAISVTGSLQATIDPYLYNITITIRPDRKVEEVLPVIDGEINRLHQTPILQTEIDRAVKQARALFAYGSENITNQAFWLGYSEMFSSYDWFLNYVDNLTTATPTLLMEAAQRLLSTSHRVTGIYLPEGSK